MADFQQKRKFKNIIYSKVSFFILFILVIFMARATYNIYSKERLSIDSYAAVEKSYQGLNTRKEMLQSEINRLKTDGGMEEEIRSRFDVAKPGETVVVVVDSSSSQDTTPTPIGFWSKFWGIFK